MQSVIDKTFKNKELYLIEKYMNFLYNMKFTMKRDELFKIFKNK